MTIQELIAKEAENLNKAFDLLKDSKSALKDLKKELQTALKNNPDYIELQERAKVLKVNRKEIGEQIKDLDKSMDQIAAGFDEYTVVEDFKNTMEEKYSEQLDKSLNILSRELAEKGIIGEVEYKNGKLSLIVSKY